MNDILDTKFPDFIITEDTTVVPFKYYFRKVGSGFERIAEASQYWEDTSFNPKTAGWYEFNNNHNDRYRFEVDNYQINNIAAICQMLAMRMTKLPKQPLNRKPGEIDFSSQFHDTVWNEVIGTNRAPKFTVPFATNLYVASNARQWTFDLGRNMTLDWADLLYHCSAFSGNTLTDAGYTFDQSSIEDTTRADDTYTLAHLWSSIDNRKLRMLLQDKRDSSTTSSAAREKIVDLMDIIDNSCRTMVHLARRFNAVYIVDVTTDGIQYNEKFIRRV